MGTEGEIAVGNVAERLGIPYALSTMGTTSIEDARRAAGDGRKLVPALRLADRAASQALVERAKAAGYTTLLLTVDTPSPGARLRDVRNGFTTPPALTSKTFADMSLHPAWWFDMLTTEPLRSRTCPAAGSVSDMVGGSWTPR